MQKLFLLMIVSLTSFTLFAQPPKGPANKGMSFGLKTTADGAIDADKLIDVLTVYPETEIKVKGRVIEVCRAEGCWLKMQTASGAMMIKMKDHSFMVPLAMNEKNIIAQGSATYKETSVEMLRHYAEDAGKTKEEIAAIKEPKKEISMQATGILVL